MKLYVQRGDQVDSQKIRDQFRSFDLVPGLHQPHITTGSRFLAPVALLRDRAVVSRLEWVSEVEVSILVYTIWLYCVKSLNAGPSKDQRGCLLSCISHGSPISRVKFKNKISKSWFTLLMTIAYPILGTEEVLICPGKAM